jgi:glycosyltransferase involved in cell wall biosynthesis
MKGRVTSTAPKPKMLFVHQGGELYGSDRVFAQTVRYASAIVDPVVVLSAGGPLVDVLQNSSSKIYIRELGVLRRKHLSVLGIVSTFWRTLRAVFFLCYLIERYHAHSVYTNTVGILSSPIAATLMRVSHVWHVHEIITTPRFLSKFLSRLVPRLSDVVVCNSFATKQNLLQGQVRFEAKTRVVHNGIDWRKFIPSGSREMTRKEMGIKRRNVFIGVIGRIHHWKGQDYFLEAAALLREANLRLMFGIIGSAYDPETDDQLARLKQLAIERGIDERVYFRDFERNISSVYEALDIVVVPSRFPEPFGLVTIEAMATAKPVIATAHGGSLEIIDDGITGFLVPTDRPDLLAEKIETLSRNPALRRKMGYAGRRKVMRIFSQERYKVDIQNVIRDALP